MGKVVPGTKLTLALILCLAPLYPLPVPSLPSACHLFTRKLHVKRIIFEFFLANTIIEIIIGRNYIKDKLM
jgi:hypothetical protein